MRSQSRIIQDVSLGFVCGLALGLLLGYISQPEVPEIKEKEDKIEKDSSDSNGPTAIALL